MDVLLARHAAKYIYCIPEGLRELMTDISREVLRSQPMNLYFFIADYLEALLITRENARIAARMVESITEISEATMQFLTKTGMERPQVDHVVAVIHEVFKKRIRDDIISIGSEPLTEEVEEANLMTDILERTDISADLAEQAAKIIQIGYKKFKTRKHMERQLLSGMIDWRIAARSAIRLYKQTGVSNEEANRVATLIKAAYKGYYTRRVMKKLIDEQKYSHPILEEEEYLRGEVEDEDEEGEYDGFLQYREQIRSTDSKSVKIDYDTVIPHVDFGDVTTAETKQLQVTDSTPSAIISYAIDKVLDNVIQVDSSYPDIAYVTTTQETEEVVKEEELWQVVTVEEYLKSAEENA